MIPRKRRSGLRKYRRIEVRYGHPAPLHKAFAMQISATGFFLSTNGAVYAPDTPVAVEIRGPAATWVVAGVVRHAVKVHPSMQQFSKPGMGVELVEAPQACRDWLASL